MLHWIFKTLLRKMLYKPMSIEELRERQAKSAGLMAKLPTSISLEKSQINETDVGWLTHENASDEKAVIYLHGGGYVSGFLPSYYMICGTLSEVTGARVVMPDYRLAPDYPFPSALEDSLSIYIWLLENGFDAENIFIAGDSAGGGLALAMTLAIRDEGRVLPAGLILLSPWTDLTFSGKSHQTKADKAVILHPENLQLWAESYLAFADPRTPHISPAFADMKNFPPMLIQVGGEEVFLDDARMVTEHAEAVGVDVTLSVYEGMWHVWQAVGILDEAKKAFEEIGKFVERIKVTG